MKYLRRLEGGQKGKTTLVVTLKFSLISTIQDLYIVINYF